MKKTIILLGLTLTNVALADLRYLHGLGDTRYHHVESEAVGRGFHVYVSVPAGYAEAAERYPALYVLDGGALYPIFASYYRYLEFGEEVPEMIIVGIAYDGDDFAGGNYRGTDYTAPSDEREYWGGAPRFQAFLDRELLPLVESTYRADSERRIIFGQSIGGQFVLYTAQTMPGLFWGHIASNPALHRNVDFFLDTRPPADAPSGSRLYVASATGDDPRFREPALAWMRHWNTVDEKPWQLATVDLEGHSHMSAPPASFRGGLRWLFGTD